MTFGEMVSSNWTGLDHVGFGAKMIVRPMDIFGAKVVMPPVTEFTVAFGAKVVVRARWIVWRAIVSP